MDIQRRINKLIKKDLERCKKLYTRLKMEINSLEEGSIAERNGVYSRYVRKNGKQYCRKITDQNLFIRLKKRHYIKKGLPILEQRIKNDANFLNKDIFYDPIGMSADMTNPYKGLSNIDVFLEGDVNPDDWIDSEYKKGEMFKEKLIYKMDAENWVRSKSETMISMRLQEYNFSIRYEPEVKVGNKILYPDFEILLSNIRRVVYYEHFGMMDNPDYAMYAMKKLEEYAANGIYLGYNLVVTYETKNNPLTLAKIDEVIEKLLDMDKS